MKTFSLILDYPTTFSFYIAFTIISIFIVFIIIVFYIAIKEVELNFIKGCFVVLTLLLIAPFLLSIDIVASKNNKNIDINELNSYAEQFNLLTKSSDYYVITRDNKYMSYKALVLTLDKKESEEKFLDEVLEFKKICTEKENIHINCAIEYDFKIYNMNRESRFDKIFSIYDNQLRIKYHRLERYKDYDLNLFKYQKETIIESSNNDIDIFLNNLAKEGINILSLEENKMDLTVVEKDKPKEQIEVKLDDTLILTIKENFPLDFKKYESLLAEIKSLNSKIDVKLDIKFNNLLLTNQEIQNEILRKSGEY